MCVCHRQCGPCTVRREVHGRQVTVQLPPPTRIYFCGDCKSSDIAIGVQNACPCCKTRYVRLAADPYNSHTSSGCRTIDDAKALFLSLRQDICLLLAASTTDIEFGQRYKHMKTYEQFEAIMLEAEGKRADEQSHQLRATLTNVLQVFAKATSTALCEEILHHRFARSAQYPVSKSKWEEIIRWLKRKHASQHKIPIEFEGAEEDPNPVQGPVSQTTPFVMHTVQKVGKHVMALNLKLLAVSPNPKCIKTAKERKEILAGMTIFLPLVFAPDFLIALSSRYYAASIALPL